MMARRLRAGRRPRAAAIPPLAKGTSIFLGFDLGHMKPTVSGVPHVYGRTIWQTTASYMLFESILTYDPTLGHPRAYLAAGAARRTRAVLLLRFEAICYEKRNTSE